MSIETNSKKAESVSFFKDLMQRRVPQILGIYLATSWAIIEFLDWLISRFSVSPHLPEFGMLILASMIPTVLLLAYFHGKPGRDTWTKIEKIGIPTNVIGAILLLLFLFNEKDLGATTTMITLTNEEGQTIERVVQKSEFRKKIMIFFLENESGDSTLNWLSYGFTDLLYTDLIQDHYIELRNGYLSDASCEKMKDAGYPNLTGLPLMLEKEIANDLHMNYFFTGSFTHQDEIYTVNTKLYNSKNGKLINHNTYENENIFELVDQLSAQLKYDLEIPDYHIEEVEDLPVSEISTKSLTALKWYITGGNEIRFNKDWNKSLSLFNQSVIEDSTFLLAYYGLYQVYTFTNQIEKTAWIFQPLMRHLYKLPEKLQLLVKSSYYEFQKEYDKQYAIYEMIIKLYPDDINARLSIIQFYIIRNQTNKAIAEYKYILELDPEQYDILEIIGSIYKGLGNFEEALDYYNRYAKLFPGRPESLRSIGGLYKTMGNFEEAKSYYKKALLLEPENISDLLILADIDLESGDFEEGLNQFQYVLQQSNTPNEKVNVYDKLGKYYNLTGQMQKEIKCIHLKFNEYEKFLPPLMLDVRKIGEMNRIVKLEEKEDVIKTLDSLDSSIGAPFEKYSSLVYLYLYLEYEDIVNIEKTIVEVEEFIEELKFEALRPVILNSLGQINEFKGEYEQAINNYCDALILEPNSSSYNISIGRCYRMLKDLKKAEENLLKTLAVHPFWPKVNYEMALIYYDMGNKDKALEYLKTTLEIWENADPEYKPAIKAKEKLAEWDQ